jgi:hypothetical protein
MFVRNTFLALGAICFVVACGSGKPVVTTGPEDCTNGVDDNGDGKVDCADPQCFDNAACTQAMENCSDHLDNNSDGLVDCADPLCAGLSCGTDCICIGGRPVSGDGGTAGGAGGGTGGGRTGGGSGGGGSAGGGSGGGSAGGGSGGGSAGGGSGGGSAGGGSGGGSAGGGSGGGSAGGGSGGGSAGGGSGGGSAGGGSGGGGSAGGGSGGGSAGGGSGGGSAGGGSGGGGVASSEICNDGIDNDGDHAIDCADAKCATSALCLNVLDGKACASDAQCAGGKCMSESNTGAPNGWCSNLNSCPTLGGKTGCNGGTCIDTGTVGFNRCYPTCTGTGLGTDGCRAGYMCSGASYPDGGTQNFCVPGCTASTECQTAASGVGCNPYSKRCGNLDQGLGKYGAACTLGSQCESGACLTGSDFPGGYCSGLCRGDLLNCGPGGYCNYDVSWGDSVGICFETCSSDASCRTSSNYSCFTVSSGSSNKVCSCLVSGSNCNVDGDCCSGYCDNGFLGTYTCY